MPQSRRENPPPVPPPRRVEFEDVLERLRKRERPFDPVFLRAVYDFSAESHREQTRRSGEPFLTHPLHVAYLLADWKFDPISVAAGLLHDVLEDTLTTKETLEERFGHDIAELVDGVTKIGRHAYVRKDQVQAETFRKMILASAKDLRVILVKLADRFHNLQTLEHLAPEARRRVAQETLEIYTPIAHRLGMAKVKGELEDLAFYHLYPHQFAELREKVEERMRLGEQWNREIGDRLRAALGVAGIECEISSRVKRYFSIWQKLRRQDVDDISQLFDYLAFRVVTRDLRDTYAALGVVHQTWRPIPGRFKDYVAMPKPNLYQSLHTTVVGEHGQAFEIQIRTREMDLIAEEGIAAHWAYKEGRSAPQTTDPNIIWLRQLIEWQQEVQDPRAFLSALKVNLYPDEVYIFTPKGEVMSFPRGATPLDFAYRVHTQIGDHCAGARVNGKLVPLRSPLQNGDIVEILTNPARTPSRDWMAFVVTPRAKSKIRHWLSTQETARAVEIGRRLLDKELREYRISVRKVLDSEVMKTYLTAEGLSRLDDLYARLGFGKLGVRHVLEAVLPKDELDGGGKAAGQRIRKAVGRILPLSGRKDGPIVVSGEGDLMTALARCCNPLPGEEIVGYVTRGRGVSVHAADCPNVRNLLYEPGREIEVRWGSDPGGSYLVGLRIETEDQQGMIARLTEIIAAQGSDIRQLGAEAWNTGRAHIDLTVEVKDRKHWERLEKVLANAPGVLHVERKRGFERKDQNKADR
jgi:GTP pyrophosphokinase